MVSNVNFDLTEINKNIKKHHLGAFVYYTYINFQTPCVTVCAYLRRILFLHMYMNRTQNEC